MPVPDNAAWNIANERDNKPAADSLGPTCQVSVYKYILYSLLKPARNMNNLYTKWIKLLCTK